MNLKLFINGKYTSVWIIILYLTGVYLTYRFITQPAYESYGGILFPGAGQWFAPSLLNPILNSVLILGIGIGLLRVNNLFSLIPKHTLLPFFFFLLFELCSPSLSLLGNGNISAAILLSILVLFFHAYQQNRAQPAFLIMGIISVGTLFCSSLFYYIPLFILGFLQIKYFSIKSLLGALLGLITPFWILIGMDLMPFSRLCLLLPDFTGSIPATLPYDDPQFLIVVLTALLGLFSGVTMLYALFNEKRQIRAYNGFTNLLSIYSAILLILDYRNYTLYLPVLNLAVAMQSAFVFTMNGKKATVVSFYLIVTLYIGLFIWNLLPA